MSARRLAVTLRPIDVFEITRDGVSEKRYYKLQNANHGSYLPPALSNPTHASYLPPSWMT